MQTRKTAILVGSVLQCLGYAAVPIAKDDISLINVAFCLVAIGLGFTDSSISSNVLDIAPRYIVMIYAIGVSIGSLHTNVYPSVR